MDPLDRDQNYPGNAAPDSEEPTHDNGRPVGDDNWLRFVVQNSSEIVKVVDPDGTLRYASPAYERILGYDPGEALSKNMFDFVYPDDLSGVLKEIERVISGEGPGGGHTVVEYRFRHKDGSWRWMEVGFTYRPDDPAVRGLVVNARDVTERKAAEESLREAEERYRTLVEQIPVVAYIDRADDSDTPLYTSPQIEGLLGYTQEEGSGSRLWRERLHPADRERVLAADERFERGEEERFGAEYRLLAKDGSVVWVLEDAVLVKDATGGPLYCQGILYDITERKGAEERLEHQALHDPLTDLPNRRLLLDRLDHALARTERGGSGQQVAVLFMDLDGFKVLNDSLGHEAGDLLLMAVAQRLKGCLRIEDTLARFGGDEFTVLVEDVEGPEEAVRVAERVLDGLESPFVLEGRELYARVSVGIALGMARFKSAEDLLRACANRLATFRT